MKLFPNETRADLQRYYGLNIDRMGVEFSSLHAAVCLANLPFGSALVARYNPRTKITMGELPILTITDALTRKQDNQLGNAVAMPIGDLIQKLNQRWVDE